MTQFAEDRRIVQWLASLGYPVEGRPREVIAALFVREAAQWRLAPSELYRLVVEAAPASSAALPADGIMLVSGGVAEKKTPPRLGFRAARGPVPLMRP